MDSLPSIRDFDEPPFDPIRATDLVFGETVDPHTPLAAVRRKTPVYEGHVGEVVADPTFGTLAAPGQREFLILGYDEVARVASDPEAFLNGPALEQSLKMSVGYTISIMDPPDHGRYRRIFQAAFLPKTIAEWGTDIVTPVINTLLDKFAPKGGGDLVENFIRPYPFQILYRQLALPEQEARVFHRLSVALMLVGGSGEFKARAIEASAKLSEYFTVLVAQRRRTPGKDLISELIQAETDGEKLSEDLIISFLRQLINAGAETTFQTTSSLLTALLLHPDQMAAVRADRSLVPQAIDEILRWEPPSAMQPRYVARDVTVGGVNIPAGSLVQICFGAATRDEKVFPEPETFNIFRQKTRHYGFGYGPHFCIGQHLARIEMQKALNAILDRLPNLRLDADKPPPVITGNTQRHVKHLYVLFD